MATKILNILSASSHIDETVSASDRVDGVATVRDDANVPLEGSVENHEDIERNTTVNKGTDTFEDDIVDSEHVNEVITQRVNRIAVTNKAVAPLMVMLTTKL